MTQTKRDTLVFQVGGWGMRMTTSPALNKTSLFRSLVMENLKTHTIIFMLPLCYCTKKEGVEGGTRADDRADSYAQFSVCTVNFLFVTSDFCFLLHFVSSIAEFTVIVFVIVSSISYDAWVCLHLIFVPYFTCLIPVDQ
jgi:hypothetical protein